MQLGIWFVNIYHDIRYLSPTKSQTLKCVLENKWGLHCFLSINGCNHSNEFVSKCVQILAGRQESEAKSFAIASCARTIHAYGHEVCSCLEIIEQRDNTRAIHSISARCYNMWLRFSQGTYVKSCMKWKALFERDHSRAMVNCDTDHKQGPVDLSVLIITRDFNVGLHFR